MSDALILAGGFLSMYAVGYGFGFMIKTAKRMFDQL